MNTQINIYIILIIILYHFIADFIFQDEKWAINKSKNLKALLTHTAVYSCMWYIPGMIYAMYNEDTYISPHVTYFVLITFVCHTITDYFTSRIVAKRFANQYYGSVIPNFGAFTIIGIDQFLHYLQLILTFQFLTT